ncbi:hypothetical protein TI39_contig377g00008 [Zymoseptoria brevis]|uniref:Uncharacterized protein n=1 Tax=Zymoseptoria brevis TaxID=1047168 RepID=A0A0F4GNP1_9PEZI|nr:hypothetical protein TI39_contig377g00008 [Zymoseptoria brevis]
MRPVVPVLCFLIGSSYATHRCIFKGVNFNFGNHIEIDDTETIGDYSRACPGEAGSCCYDVDNRGDDTYVYCRNACPFPNALCVDYDQSKGGADCSCEHSNSVRLAIFLLHPSYR